MFRTSEPGSLDDASRITELRATIARKQGLRRLYEDIYRRYAACVARCAGVEGQVLELGSGAGFAKSFVPELVTSDVIPYDGVDHVVDACRMPFADASLRAIVMFNVFHHIRDVEQFFREAVRCLRPGGRMLIVDQYRGVLSELILRNFHHEAYDPDSRDWAFAASGPLTSANGALAWIVFWRDRARFEWLFPELRVERITPHTPLRYWLTGGLKRWTLLPGALFGLATHVDNGLAKTIPQLASFVDIELVRA